MSSEISLLQLVALCYHGNSSRRPMLQVCQSCFQLRQTVFLPVQRCCHLAKCTGTTMPDFSEYVLPSTLHQVNSYLGSNSLHTPSTTLRANVVSMSCGQTDVQHDSLRINNFKLFGDHGF